MRDCIFLRTFSVLETLENETCTIKFIVSDYYYSYFLQNMFYPNYKKSENHEANRYKICLLCLQKSKRMFIISETIKLKLIKCCVEYNDVVEIVSAVLCPKCEKSLHKASKCGQTIKIPELEKFTQRVTRSSSKSQKCLCFLCTLMSHNKHENFLKASEQVTEQRKKSTLKPVTVKVQNQEKRCSQCFSIISRGKKHKCHRTGLVENLTDSVDRLDDTKLKEQVVSKLLKKIATSKNNLDDTSKNKRDISVSLSQNRGKLLNVTLRLTEHKAPVIYANSLKKMQTTLNLSKRKVLTVAKFIRSETKNPNIIETNFKNKLDEMSHVLDDLFETQKFNFVHEEGGIMKECAKIAIQCKNVPELIYYVIGQRNLTNVHIKIGIDGGGGFLKVTLSVQPSYEDTINNLSTSKQNNHSTFKESGVKKIFIIFLAPSTQENYTNVALIWSSLKLNEILGTVSTDLKLANILTGLMTSASLHPCIWCDALMKELNTCGSRRTIKNCTDNYSKWCDSGKEKKNAKHFMNCVNLPVFVGDENTLILDLIPPPELHLLLGAVNTLFTHMLKVNEKICLKWAEKCNVQRQCVYGSPTFAGNACKILLEKVDILDGFKCLECVKFVDTFRKLKKVVNGCFSMKLDPNFVSFIREFKESYLALEISVTPKIHAIFFHVEDFCLKTGKGLAYYSEQATESAHSDFAKMWDNYKVLDIHPEYPQKLLRAVCDYNTSHI